jgi:hypothetical protein
MTGSITETQLEFHKKIKDISGKPDTVYPNGHEKADVVPRLEVFDGVIVNRVLTLDGDTLATLLFQVDVVVKGEKQSGEMRAEVQRLLDGIPFGTLIGSGQTERPPDIQGYRKDGSNYRCSLSFYCQLLIGESPITLPPHPDDVDGEPPWPPTNTLFHLHKDMTFTGSDSDVQSITFGNGITFNKAGSGTITRSDSGFTFDGDAYFDYTVSPSVNMGGFSVHSALTFGGANDSVNNYAFRGASNAYVYFRKSNNRFYTAVKNSEWEADGRITSGQRAIVGLFADDEYPENGAKYSMWIDGHIVAAEEGDTDFTNSYWQIGNGFEGTIHEAVIFARPEVDPDLELSCVEIQNKLLELWPV